ncbi:MAG: hypothetical protein MJ213_03230 [Bacilli bacterium]|nr:hypothetical protein [Bacilli bacterium]
MKNSKINVGLVALLMSTGLLVGCNSGPNIGPEEKPHEHALVSIDAKDPTYYKEGNIKYYYCPDCNKKFSDSTGTTEISDADIILKKKTILEETTEAQEEDVEYVLQTAVVAPNTATKKFVSLEGDVTTGLYVSNNKQGDYTTITLGLSEATDDIVAFEFDYRYLDNCNDRKYDMLGHNYISTKVGGESSFVPHTNGKLNKDCAWHTFSYHEDNNLEDGITAFEINIYHFDGELVINNVYVIHEVAGSTATATDPATVDHYEDLESGVYWYDYDNDEYIPVAKEDIEIAKQPGLKPTCDNAGYKEYYFCGYTREYYEDKNGETVIEDIDAWKAEGGAGYLAPAHELEPVSGLSATCTAAGYKDCYKCKACGKYFEDSEAKKIIGTEGTQAEYEVWKTGDGKIEALGHAFGEDGNCTRTGCTETIKNYLSLEDASRSDLMTKISLSGIGINAPDWTSLSDDHTWGSYDLVADGGIDLTFDVQLDSAATSESLVVYVGSKGHDETGMKFRFDYNSENQAYGGYIYGSSDNDLPGAGEQNGTKYTIPDFTTTEKTITARITLTQDTSNPYKFAFALYVNGHKAKEPDGRPSLLDSVTFNGTDARNTIRFSQTTKAKIKESTVENPVELILMSGNTIYGKKTDFTSPITMPNLVKEGYKFLGWFDNESNKVASTISSITKKTIVKPLFVEDEANMYVPSDFGYTTEGTTFTPTFGTEYYQPNNNLPEGADRIDAYFIIKPSLVTADEFFYFGIPFDSTDAKTRVSVRVSLAHNNWYWHSQSTSIGGAGATGTSFLPNGLTWSSGVNYLFHCYIENTNNQDTPFRFGFDVTNLADFTTFASSKDFKFNEDPGYTIGNKERSKLYFYMPAEFGDPPVPATSTFTITDAW